MKRGGCKGIKDHVALTSYDPNCQLLDLLLQFCIWTCFCVKEGRK